ncbi:hypothetical protein RhiirA1_447524 [Rhizophagus irregularis]|uniref:Uncharacterized protein n=1 Tax=Rhizophagus irregularis TaxID=588596 RepID=A0A2I1E2A6_9GLOM|nr:hypothetical protein RhiirA1_447524 [Rhizophagus irregularis]PKY16267.1 hypothetical protein RhiirB3_428606 [Rhizophagus irregularis]CAB4467023.1 unnamed protein product [Rhizophagus irregularis]
MTKINSHLILTQEQKENLRSLPDSEFTDKKWESPNDAAPFLKEHGLILENKPERKWKVRYSDKAKGICLLQCCCGSDASLRPKNGNSKARKSRQVYKFVGCLAHARIKTYKNNCIEVSGYLIHLEDCQRQTSTNNETEEQIESWRKSNDEFQPWEEIYEKLNLLDSKLMAALMSNDYVTNITNNEEFEN